MFIDTKNADLNKNINLIHLHLDPKDANFRCYINPLTNHYGIDDIWTDNKVRISFRDSHELDNLIYVLQKFRENCHGLIGNWREVNYRG